MPLLESLGVRAVEVFLTSFSEYGYPYAELLKERKGSLRVNSVHDLNTQFEPQLFNANPRVKEDAYGWLGKVMESAQALGAPYYTFHGTARMKRAARLEGADNYPNMIARFQEISEFCGKYGVKLCLENVEWATYNRPGVFSRLAEAVPNLGGVLDIKQARISEYPYEAYLQEMGARITHAHVSDIDEQGKICLPGKGTFDFDTLVKRLKDVGFDGALIVEVYTGDYGKAEELKRSCEYLDEILYKNK